jgi:hypothetical protein
MNFSILHLVIPHTEENDFMDLMQDGNKYTIYLNLDGIGKSRKFEEMQEAISKFNELTEIIAKGWDSTEVRFETLMK